MLQTTDRKVQDQAQAIGQPRSQGPHLPWKKDSGNEVGQRKVLCSLAWRTGDICKSAGKQETRAETRAAWLSRDKSVELDSHLTLCLPEKRKKKKQKTKKQKQ